MKTTDELRGRDGETKDELLDWFCRRGADTGRLGLNLLNAEQLDMLAGFVTAQRIEGRRDEEKSCRDKATAKPAEWTHEIVSASLAVCDYFAYASFDEIDEDLGIAHGTDRLRDLWSRLERLRRAAGKSG